MANFIFNPQKCANRPKNEPGTLFESKIMQKSQIGREHRRGVMGSPMKRTKQGKNGKIQIFHEKSEKQARIAMAFTKNIYIKLVNEFVLL